MRFNGMGKDDFPADGIFYWDFSYIIIVEVPVDRRWEDGDKV